MIAAINRGKNVQSIMPVLLLAVLGFIAYKLFGKSQSEIVSSKLLKNFPDPDKGKTTFSSGQALIYASQLESAFNSFGTDEQAVYDVFQMIKNEHDMRLVYKSFGIKSYGLWPWVENLDLLAIINREMSISEIQPIQTKLSWISY